MVEQSSLSLIKVRQLILIGIMFIAAFMLADLSLLPEHLKKYYIYSRVYMQIPICLCFLFSTYHQSCAKHYQKILFVSMLSLVYINYGVILICWQLGQFAFPYEGTVMYSLFTLFVFRQSFKYGIAFTICVISGFVILNLMYPIYGDQSGVKLGFVIIGSFAGLLGVRQVERALISLKTANLKLDKLSKTDHLTGLYNRRAYELRFDEQISLNKREGKSVCVFLLDLDNFKDYNDSYGHVEGDKVIKCQAEQLLQLFKRKSDIIARYGGEEFVVVVSKITHEQCIEFAKAIIEQWAQKKLTHGKGKAGQYVTCSIGFYIEHVSKNTDPIKMVEKADKALYKAKEQGRNCFYEYKND